MKIKDLKKWFANIPESMDDAELYYADFVGGPDLRMWIDINGARIIDSASDAGDYCDHRKEGGGNA